jgi:pyridoxine kinase
MPTAVLSTHTGGFTGYTFRDLTSDLRPFARHWKSLGLNFDAIYSGYLGSFEQLEIVGEIVDTFKTENNIILIDPVMADNGELYGAFTPDFVTGMAKFCAKADIITPNMTEAAIMLGLTYRDGPYEKAYIETLLSGLAELGPRYIVLTGVCFDAKNIGAASYDKVSGEVCYELSGRIDGFYHGTGDIFASALLAGLLNGLPIDKASQLAVDFTQGSIVRTKAAGTDPLFGVNFEAGLPQLIKDLGLL